MNYYELVRLIKKLNRIYYAKLITAIALVAIGIYLVIFVVGSFWSSQTLVLFGGLGIWFTHSAKKEGKMLDELKPKKLEYEKRKEE